MSSPLHKRKAHPIEDFLATVLLCTDAKRQLNIYEDTVYLNVNNSILRVTSRSKLSSLSLDL